MAEVPGMSSRQRWTLVLVCTAVFMLLLDVTVVSVALPSIQRELRASLPDLQWVSAAYALVLAVLLLPAATLGDGPCVPLVLDLSTDGYNDLCSDLLSRKPSRPAAMALARAPRALGAEPDAVSPRAREGVRPGWER